ncbi:MAG: cation-translocating P-type ATPase [Bacteroidales bacterium]|nr:cation-translocating P-type ATPase [Bacteroidales bacterium]
MIKVFDIEGMHCASCAYRLQKQLNHINGVKNATVNLASESAVIDYQPEIVSYQQLSETVAKMGYKLVESTNEKWRSHHYMRKRKRRWLKQNLRKTQLIISIIFFVPLLIIGLDSVFSSSISRNIGYVLTPSNYSIIQLILVFPIIFIGWRFIKKGWIKIVGLHPNVDSVVALGATASIVLSLISTYKVIFQFVPTDTFSLYYVIAGALLLFTMLGRYIENQLRFKSDKSIQSLIGTIPEFGIIAEHKKKKKVSVFDIKNNDLVYVAAKSYIPVDGIIVDGESKISEEIFSGTTHPYHKNVSDKVLAGMFNITSPIYIKTENSEGQTFINSIIRILEQGEASKPKIGELSDKISAWFVPILLLLSIGAGVVWYFISMDYSLAIRIFIHTLIVASPVALGFAIPISVYYATRKGSELGILIRKSDSLVSIEKSNIVAFNLTGTLTEGEPIVSDVISLGSYSKNELLSIAASAEKHSKYPLGKAIVRKAREEKIDIKEPDISKILTGQGIEAVVDEKRIDIGNYKLMSLININEGELHDALNIVTELNTQGKTSVIIAVDGIIEGVVAVNDEFADGAKSVIDYLRNNDKQSVIITGEHSTTANKLGELLGIERIFADVIASNRARKIRSLQFENKIVVMIGDGINDAGAIAQSNAGIAIGTPENITADIADIILPNRDIKLLKKLFYLSKKSYRNMKENLFFALVYNVLMIPIAAGILYVFGVDYILNPFIALLCMFLSSVSVIINALRLKRIK